MNENQFCRLCINVISSSRKNDFTDSGIREMLIIIFPQMNINLTESINLCEDCLNNLSFAMRVRKSYLTRIRAEPEKILINFPHCQVCFESESDLKPLLHKLNHSETVLRHSLNVALPEHKKLYQDITICSICWSWIKTICSFKSKCLKLEEYLYWYSVRQDNKTLSNKDIESILQEKYQRFIATHFGNNRIKEITLNPVGDIDVSANKNGELSKIPNIQNVTKKSSKKSFATQTKELSRNTTKKSKVTNFLKRQLENNANNDVDDEFDECKEKIINDNDVVTLRDTSTERSIKGSPSNIFLEDFATDTSLTKENMNKLNLNQNKSNHLTLIESNLQSINNNNNNNSVDDNYQVTLYRESSQFPNFGDNLRNVKNSSKLAKDDTISIGSSSHISSYLFTHEANTSEYFLNNANEVSKEPYLMPSGFSPDCDITVDDDTTLFINKPNEVGYNLEECLPFPEENCYEMASDNDIIDLTNVDEYCNELATSKTERNINSFEGISWACYYCKAIFAKKSSIMTHLLNHDDPWYKYGRFKCKLCPFRANWKGSITRHQIFHTKESNKRYSRDKLQFLCPYCNIIYFNKERVQNHVAEHVIDWNKFQCVDCMFSTESGTALRRHYRVNHCQKVDPNFLPRRKKEIAEGDFADPFLDQK